MKESKKIGICTLNEACNMGAILQAFALQETLKGMGYTPSFLKLKNCIIHDEAWRTDELINMRKCLNISESYYNSKEDKYDVIIVGSDEIWNVHGNSFENIDEFLGYNLNAPKIIAYAPSANATNGKMFKERYKGKNLSNFTSLSARDRNAQDIIKEVENINAPLVLDPTFLIESYDKYLGECLEKDYILLYGWCFRDEEKLEIIKFARSKNLKLYSVGYELDWCDKFIGSDIFKFLAYMKNANYSVTSDTFHGTVFSIMFNKQFVTMTHGKVKSREFIERIGMENRDCKRPDEIAKKLEEPIDYSNANKWIESERNKSIEYLRNAIEN